MSFWMMILGVTIFKLENKHLSCKKRSAESSTRVKKSKVIHCNSFSQANKDLGLELRLGLNCSLPCPYTLSFQIPSLKGSFWQGR